MKNSPIRPTPLALALVGPLLFASCGLTEEAWVEEAPTLSCKLLRRCDPIDFYGDFADLDACVQATSLGDTEGCRYDEGMARECRKALEWSCRKIGERYDEVVARCNAIWTCDTGTVVPGGPGLL